MDEEIIGPQIFDTGEGIRMELPIADGIGMYIDMDDEQAKIMIGIIQNKLNGRW